MRFRNRSLARFCAIITVALLAGGIAAAHPRARAHHHARRTPVIVIGKPRPAHRVVVVNGARYGVLDLNVKPRATEVWVDGTLRGTCDEFDGYPDKLTLAPGMHAIRLVTPDGDDVSRSLRVRAGIEINVGLDLR